MVQYDAYAICRTHSVPFLCACICTCQPPCRYQMTAFADDYDVVALDMRGYNTSDKPQVCALTTHGTAMCLVGPRVVSCARTPAIGEQIDVVALPQPLLYCLVRPASFSLHTLTPPTPPAQPQPPHYNNRVLTTTSLMCWPQMSRRLCRHSATPAAPSWHTTGVVESHG